MFKKTNFLCYTLKCVYVILHATVMWVTEKRKICRNNQLKFAHTMIHFTAKIILLTEKNSFSYHSVLQNYLELIIRLRKKNY